MRRHRHVTLGGNRCAAAEAPVLPHKARIFGMSNEQVLCIIHLCSIFHAEEQESGFFGVCWGGLSEKKKKKKKKNAASLLAQCGAPLSRIPQSSGVSMFLCTVCVNICTCPQCHAESVTCVD